MARETTLARKGGDAPTDSATTLAYPERDYSFGLVLAATGLCREEGVRRPPSLEVVAFCVGWREAGNEELDFAVRHRGHQARASQMQM